jgi:hypothetical protein
MSLEHLSIQLEMTSIVDSGNSHKVKKQTCGIKKAQRVLYYALCL